jgi:hypothetical protein
LAHGFADSPSSVAISLGSRLFEDDEQEHLALRCRKRQHGGLESRLELGRGELRVGRAADR